MLYPDSTLSQSESGFLLKAFSASPPFPHLCHGKGKGPAASPDRAISGPPPPSGKSNPKKDEKMKKSVLSTFCTLGAACLLVFSCSDDIDMPSLEGDNTTIGDDTSSSGTSGSGSGSSTTTTPSSGSNSSGDLTTFEIKLDKTALAESVDVQGDDDDFIQNTSFAHTVKVVYAQGGSASVSSDLGTDLKVSVSGNDVTLTYEGSENVVYDLSGKSTDGFFKLYSSKKQAIRLSGLTLKNPDGAAINNQSGKRTFVVLSDGSENYLEDGTAYADAVEEEDMKAALFSEGQLIFSGEGYLEVKGNCKAGIRSDDYVRVMPGANIWVETSSGNALRGNDAVVVTGGVINLKVSGASDKGISTDGYVQIDGGRTTIITTGAPKWDSDENDYSACAGVKADTEFLISGGELNCLSSGAGGKGISTDGPATFAGGHVRVITTGRQYTSGSSSVSPKGIKADGDMVVEGGIIQVRSTGGEGAEGIESKGQIYVRGGTVESYSYDDAINGKGDVTVSGGYVYAHATNNDGIDANRNLYLNGGLVIAVGGAQPENPLDAAEGYNIYVNGGTVVAYGASLAQTSSSSSQASVAGSASKGTAVALFDSDTPLLYFKTPSTSGGTALMISTPALKKNTQYTLSQGVTLLGGTTFYGLCTDATVSAKSGSSQTVSAALQVGQGMGGGGTIGGGGRPGGGW